MIRYFDNLPLDAKIYYKGFSSTIGTLINEGWEITACYNRHKKDKKYLLQIRDVKNSLIGIYKCDSFDFVDPIIFEDIFLEYNGKMRKPNRLHQLDYYCEESIPILLEIINELLFVKFKKFIKQDKFSDFEKIIQFKKFL